MIDLSKPWSRRACGRDGTAVRRAPTCRVCNGCAIGRSRRILAVSPQGHAADAAICRVSRRTGERALLPSLRRHAITWRTVWSPVYSVCSSGISSSSNVPGAFFNRVPGRHRPTFHEPGFRTCPGSGIARSASMSLMTRLGVCPPRSCRPGRISMGWQIRWSIGRACRPEVTRARGGTHSRCCTGEPCSRDLLDDLRHNTSGLPDLVLFPHAMAAMSSSRSRVRETRCRSTSVAGCSCFAQHAIACRVVNVRWAVQEAGGTLVTPSGQPGCRAELDPPIRPGDHVWTAVPRTVRRSPWPSAPWRAFACRTGDLAPGRVAGVTARQGQHGPINRCRQRDTALDETLVGRVQCRPSLRDRRRRPVCLTGRIDLYSECRAPA